MNALIDRLWHEAGLQHIGEPSSVVKFAALVAEECAKVAEDEDHRVDGRGYYDQLGDARATQHNIVTAIRAKFPMPEEFNRQPSTPPSAGTSKE